MELANNIGILFAYSTAIGAIMSWLLRFVTGKAFFDTKKYKIIAAIFAGVNFFTILVIEGFITYYPKVVFADTFLTFLFFLAVNSIAALIIVYVFKKKGGGDNIADIVKSEIEKINNNDSKEYKTMNGVIAVSAIIITKDNKFLLVKKKEQDKWVQPGAFYRTNIISNETKDMRAPFQFIDEKMREETGIFDFEYINLSGNGINEIKSTYKYDPKRKSQYNSLKHNNIVPTPFLIQEEVSDEIKSVSKKNVHIDMFYAFSLTEDFDAKKHMESEKGKYILDTFSLEQIDKEIDKEIDNNGGTIYQDLYVICSQFMKLYRKTKYNPANIRYCTFNPSNKTIELQISQACNSKCVFCMHQGKPFLKQSGAGFDKEGLVVAFNGFDLKETGYGLVVTGGEPLLNKNLFEDLTYTLTESNILHKLKSICICTNGILGMDFISNIEGFKEVLDEVNKSLKFVINMPAYSKESFQELTGSREYVKVMKFVAKLRYLKIKTSLNVVMTRNFNSKIGEYVEFWNKQKIKNITLSYAINNLKLEELINKEECLMAYQQLFDGNFKIENFETLELQIPSCDNLNCRENKSIISISKREGKYNIKEQCLDYKESRRNIVQNEKGIYFYRRKIMIEFELKFEVENLSKWFETNKPQKVVEQSDVYYDFSDYGLYKKGDFIRIRNGYKIDFKIDIDDNDHLYCKEMTFKKDEIDERNTDINEIMSFLGTSSEQHYSNISEFIIAYELVELANITKKRTQYDYGNGITIAVDRVNDLGTFIEIEMLIDENDFKNKDANDLNKIAKEILNKIDINESVEVKIGYVELYLKEKNYALYQLGKFQE